MQKEKQNNKFTEAIEKSINKINEVIDTNMIIGTPINLSSNETESTTSKILHKNCQRDKCLRIYCSTLKLPCVKTETKRRMKHMCPTNIIKESSIEQIKNTIKKRRNRKSNSVCYITNQK